MRCTGAAEQQGKGEHFGLTSGCNSQRKASISEHEVPHSLSQIPGIPQPPTVCLVVSVRSSVLGPLGRRPVAHTGAGCDPNLVHFVGMERVQRDLGLISTHFDGGHLICWNQGDTTANRDFPAKGKYS